MGTSISAQPQRPTSTALILLPGTKPPRAEAFRGLADRGLVVTEVAPGRETLWQLRIEQPKIGRVLLAAHDPAIVLPAVLLEHDGRLTRGERAQVSKSRTSVTLTSEIEGERLLSDRKRFLRIARAVMGRGETALLDPLSQRLWTSDALDDELSFDSDLDVDGLYQLHAVTEKEGTKPIWLHTHGLGVVGAFDFDILKPDTHLLFARQDVLRALAFAVVEGDADEHTDAFELAYPNGDVRFVPASDFMANAAQEEAALRSDDEDHMTARMVVCEPATKAYTQVTGKPCAALYTSATEEDGSVLHLSKTATDLTAARARASTELLRRIAYDLRSVKHTALLKLVHLWFRAHGFARSSVDATLMNEPHDIRQLRAGVRDRHALERVSDWMVMTEEGIITCRDTMAIRRLREAGFIE